MTLFVTDAEIQQIAKEVTRVGVGDAFLHLTTVDMTPHAGILKVIQTM
jgi:hypothetical protein